MKHMIILSISLALIAVFLGKWALNERDGRIVAEKELMLCEEEKIAYNEKDLQASKTIAELRKRALQDKKSDCDCYNIPVPSTIIEFVRQQRKNTNKK